MWDMNNSTFHVRILSPQQLLLDAEAESVSSENIQGKFDILASHANFITLVEKHPIVIRLPKQKPLVYQFPIAIILCQEDKVDIYTYIQPQPEANK